MNKIIEPIDPNESFRDGCIRMDREIKILRNQLDEIINRLERLEKNEL